MAARRRRRNLLDSGPPGGARFFSPPKSPIGSAGRAPWRSKLTRELLRLFPTGLSRPRDLSQVLRPRPALRSRRDRIATQPSTLVRQAQPVRLTRRFPPLAKPVLVRRASVCEAREDRREAMFAAGVAGRRWSKGGPRMFGARRSVSSNYSCEGKR